MLLGSLFSPFWLSDSGIQAEGVTARGRLGLCACERSCETGVTVGKNESRIAEYIENQLKEDEMCEQLVIPSASPFTGRK